MTAINTVPCTGIGTGCHGFRIELELQTLELIRIVKFKNVGIGIGIAKSEMTPAPVIVYEMKHVSYVVIPVL